jgi:hypothetical protein
LTFSFDLNKFIPITYKVSDPALKRLDIARAIQFCGHDTEPGSFQIANLAGERKKLSIREYILLGKAIVAEFGSITFTPYNTLIQVQRSRPQAGPHKPKKPS